MISCLHYYLYYPFLFITCFINFFRFEKIVIIFINPQFIPTNLTQINFTTLVIIIPIQKSYLNFLITILFIPLTINHLAIIINFIIFSIKTSSIH